MTVGLKILSITPGTTVQDLGRTGFLRYGVTGGGAMDVFALAEGQALLGNVVEDAALEFAGAGGRFQATGAVSVATSGAVMSLKLNGAPVGWRQSLRMETGDTLDIGAVVDGVYGYLHIAGGFQTSRVLGARSTHLRAGFGHVPKTGDVLLAGAPKRSSNRVGLPRSGYFDQRVLRVIWGPQSHHFSEDTRARFAQAVFEVTKMRDRMGIQVRPDSGAIKSAAGLTIASDAINLGDIQVTGDGTPAILLADRGSSGGYPRIATLITADVPALAQIPTGDSFTLEVIERSTAVDLLGKFRATLAGLPGKTAPMVRDPRDMGDLLAYNLIDGMLRGDEHDDN